MTRLLRLLLRGSTHRCLIVLLEMCKWTCQDAAGIDQWPTLQLLDIVMRSEVWQQKLLLLVRRLWFDAMSTVRVAVAQASLPCRDIICEIGYIPNRNATCNAS